MTDTGRSRRRSVVGPIILIGFGVLFLAFNFYPGFNPWPILWRYWPLILILVGVGHIIDHYLGRQQTDQPASRGLSATSVAWLVLLVLFIVAVVHAGRRGPERTWRDGWGWQPRRDYGHEMHDTQAIELQGAKSVSVNLDMGAGEMTLEGGSSRLLDADFRYVSEWGKPRVDYSVSGDHGQLRISQPGEGNVFGTTDAEWDLKMGGGVPLDIRLNMGAGQNNLRLSELDVHHLDVHMGAGELNLDVTGPRKSDLRATIEGGAGEATIRLPKNVGVRVVAEGGLGAINTNGLTRDGGAYVNSAYGKTANTIEISVHGGVGQINLEVE